MKLLLIIPLLFVSFASFGQAATDKEKDGNQEKLVYIMPDDRGWQLVEQCTRSFYYPEVFWRVTPGQVEAIEKFLIRHLEKLKNNNASFVPEALSNYKRQYVGFEMDGTSYLYGNFFPKGVELEVDPARQGVVSCRGDKRYWGMLFNIDSFEFEAIERNDKMLKPKGAFDPKYWDNREAEPADQEPEL